MLKWLPQNIPNVSLPEVFAKAKKSTAKLLPAPAPKVDLPQLPIPDTPFDRYRLRRLLQKLNLGMVYGRSVMEVGCGVGDLLLEIAKHQPKEIFGVERKQDSYNYARKALKIAHVEAHLVLVPSYKYLHFPDKSFDFVFVMHEFDGLTYDKLVEDIAREASRISRQWIVLVEETAEGRTERLGKTRRTVQFYRELFQQQHLPHKKDGHFKKNNYEQKGQGAQEKQPDYHRHQPQFKQESPRQQNWRNKRTGGSFHQEHLKNRESQKQEVEHKEVHRFFLRKVEYLDVKASRYIFTGRSNPWHWIRWLLSPLLWLLGFPSTWFRPPVGETELPKSNLALKMQEKLLPLTSGLDDIFTANRGITIMWFERERLFRRG